MNEVTEEEIGKALSGMMRSFDAEYREMSEADLDGKWLYKHDPDLPIELTMYRFLSMLTLYSGSCRRWEEMHNGSGCVVERVRDKYTLPKIKEFCRQINLLPPTQ